MELYMCERCGKMMKQRPEIEVVVTDMTTICSERHHVCNKCRKELLDFLDAKVPDTPEGIPHGKSKTGHGIFKKS